MTRLSPAASPRRAAPPSHARRNRAAALLSLGANAVLLAVKLVAGLVTGSVAVLSEAANSGGDLVASGIALTSVRAAARPPDLEHPYGHERAENVGAAVEGALIVGAGVYVVVEAIRRLGDSAPVDHLELAIGVMVASVAVNIAVSARLRTVARSTGSPAIAGDAAHLRSDVWTTGGAAVGLVVVAATGWEPLDPIIGLAVAGYVIWIGGRIAWQAGQVLVDRNLPASELEVIGRVLGDFSGEGVSFHAVRGRRAGAKRHVDLHMVVPPDTTVRRGHAMTGEVKGALVTALPGTDVLIHLEDRPRPAGDADARRPRA